MDKRKMKTYRDRLLARREGLFRQVTEAEMSSRERDLEATQDPADMAANAYTKELMMSMSTNDRQLLESIDAALHRIADGGYGKCIHCGEPFKPNELECSSCGGEPNPNATPGREYDGRGCAWLLRSGLRLAQSEFQKSTRLWPGSGNAVTLAAPTY